jgi:hypothetical protein
MGCGSSMTHGGHVFPTHQNNPTVPQHQAIQHHTLQHKITQHQALQNQAPQHQAPISTARNIKPAYDAQPSSLFQRKFVSDSIDNEFIWVGLNGVVSRMTLMERLPVCTIHDAVRKILQSDELKKAKNINEVYDALKKALGSSDVRYLIFAYTIQSDFYIILNKKLSNLAVSSSFTNYLAALVVKNDSHETASWPLFFTSVVLKAVATPGSRLKSFGGKTYRGITMSQDDLRRYSVNSIVVQKTFTSSSKNSAVAIEFARRSKGGKITAVFTFALDNSNTICIDLAGMTAFEDEEEVLILPLSVFIVTKVSLPSSANGFTEVELRAFSATATVKSMIPSIGTVVAPVGYIASALNSINPVGLTRGIRKSFSERYLNSDGTRNNSVENRSDDEVDQSDGDGDNDDPEEEPSENDDEEDEEEDDE